MRVCVECATIYSSDVCPHCGAAEYIWEWDMPKISKHAGPSTGPSAVDTVAAEPVEVVEEAEVTEPVSQYSTWLRTDLQGECERRGLSRSGNKDELIERLTADDAKVDAEIKAGEPEYQFGDTE
ncbi:MAG: SAP domain-containing protein [Micromonosporaceae bacterium]